MAVLGAFGFSVWVYVIFFLDPKLDKIIKLLEEK